MKGWKFIEGITVSDVAFEAYGQTLEELFANAANALMEIMVDVATVDQRRSLKFKVQSLKLDELLFDFLNELVFLKDAENLVFSKFDVEIKKLDDKSYSLDANMWGDEIDHSKHNLRLDVKAVTKHKFSLKRRKGRYIVRVVLDI